METWSLTIPDLIHFVKKEKSLALPEFQRNWEWDADDVAEMLRTVIANWPSGSILVMAVQSDDLKFELRSLRDAPGLDMDKVKYAVLDGQQRLTSVYRACTGVAGETYYVDMARVAEIGGFDDDCLSYKKNEDFEAAHGNRLERANAGIVTVEELYSESAFDDWRHELAEPQAEEMNELFGSGSV